MDLEAALLQRQGIQHAGDTMRDGLAGDIIHIQACQGDTDGGEHQVEQVALVDVETAGEKSRNQADERLEQDCCKARRNAHDEGEHHDKGLVGHIFLTPDDQAFPPVGSAFSGTAIMGMNCMSG